MLFLTQCSLKEKNSLEQCHKKIRLADDFAKRHFLERIITKKKIISYLYHNLIKGYMLFIIYSLSYIILVHKFLQFHLNQFVLILLLYNLYVPYNH